ncbi:hypothetical protein, partial [Enterococcus casseliflavus]|uniref:hypothetical protein n=1 Tax=Enterococcus casseliflavus TaxID=37734 RepID=UPI003D0E744C
VFHAIDAQTHGSEAFASAVLLYALVAYAERPGYARAAGLGLALALGAAFRPTFVITGVLPIIVACVRAPKHVVAAG